MILLVVGCGIQPSPPEGAAEQIAHPGSLWSIAQLAQADQNVLILDIRKSDDYARGHIPNARQLWRSAFTIEVDGGESLGRYGGMACSRNEMSNLLDSLGAREKQQIVVYDGVGGCDAARVWWMLRLYGHREVALLDGGVPAWEAAGKAVSVETDSAPQRHGFAFGHKGQNELLVTMEEVDLARTDGQTILLDTRSASEYHGEMKKRGAMRAGRIPGSAHYDWGNAVNLEGLGEMKPLKDLIYDLAQRDIRPDTHVITYCHSGVRSAHTTFVLREILGYTHVRNYDGSWMEYSRQKGD